MLREALLLRENGRVASYIDDHVKLVGADRRDEVLELFDQMYRFFPHWVITTCPMMHPDVHYISQNCTAVFGYTREFFIRNAPLQKFIMLVHEDDREDLFKCISHIHGCMEEIGAEEHHKHRVVLHYRFRQADGAYIHLHDEKAAVNLRGAGTLYYTLFKDITDMRPFGGVKLELFRQDDVLVKVKEFRPSIVRHPLTSREQDLVTLIRQGLSTKEIACQLKISHNTVRNIKSKLFEKYNVSNSIELLNLTSLTA